MRHNHLLPELGELVLPLRDLRRGLRHRSVGPRVVLEPALDLLPVWVREPMEQFVSDIGRGEAQLFRGGQLDTGTIACAAAGLRGADASPADIATSAAYAAEALLKERQENDLLVSETVAAICWRRSAGKENCAAQFARRLHRHDFISSAPGLIHEADSHGDAQKRRICSAIVMWLLADRPATVAEEIELIRIAGWLAEAVSADIEQCWSDAVSLDALLRSSAERI